MNESDQLQWLVDSLNDYAKGVGGIALPAYDLHHAWQVLSQKPGQLKLVVVCDGETCRENFPGGEITGRVDRAFSVLVSRSRGLNSVRGESLTSGTAGQPGLLSVVGDIRDGIRAAITPDGCERPIYYKGFEQWGEQVGAVIDAYRVRFEIGTQLDPIEDQPPTGTWTASGVSTGVGTAPTVGGEVYMSGVINLTAGQQNGAVTGLGLTFAPRKVLLQVIVPDGGESIGAWVVQGTLTQDGFSFELNSSVPDTNYSIDYLILP